MSISSLRVILERVTAAKPNSKIALFRYLNKGEYCIDAVFASTVNTVNRIKHDDGRYLGSFYCDSDIKQVTQIYNDVIGEWNEYISR